LKLITVYLPEPHIEALDELVRLRLYKDRSEAIRFAVRDLIHRYLNAVMEGGEVRWVPKGKGSER